MYTNFDFETKKALKEAVARCNELYAPEAWASGNETGLTEFNKLDARLRVFQPGPFGGNEPREGKVYLEGPHYPQPHKWYAEAILKDGRVIKVK